MSLIPSNISFAPRLVPVAPNRCGARMFTGFWSWEFEQKLDTEVMKSRHMFIYLTKMDVEVHTTKTDGENSTKDGELNFITTM